MNDVLHFRGMSQFAEEIKNEYRSSACGPVTAYTILRHTVQDSNDCTVNSLYKDLGCTKVGLTKRRFIRNLRRRLGPVWIIESCGIEMVKKEIAEGRPVAAKFDKWTALRWGGTYDFDYHWVPVVGFEEVDGELFLLIHDNGNRNGESRIRRVSYSANEPILSFVKVEKPA